MLIFNQTSSTIFVEKESDNRDGGDISFIPIQPGETHNIEPNWVYRIHSGAGGSAVIAKQGKNIHLFGELFAKVKEDFIIVS